MTSTTSSYVLAGFAFVFGVAVSAGVTAFAHNPGAMSLHHGAPTAETIDAHVDRLLQHIAAETGLDDAQKARVEPIVRQAASELLPMHDQVHAAHAQLLALLGADKIDRDAIERVRSDQMRLFDQASQRLATLVEDVADVLTPAQRKAFTERFSMHMQANG
jgi:Spy/CpxP family protein refolding chaperone